MKIQIETRTSSLDNVEGFIRINDFKFGVTSPDSCKYETNDLGLLKGKFIPTEQVFYIEGENLIFPDTTRATLDESRNNFIVKFPDWENK